MIFNLLIKFSSFIFYRCCFNNNYWFSLFNFNWLCLFNFLRSYCSSLKWICMSFHNDNVAECTIIYTHIFDRSRCLLRWSRCLSAKAAEGIFCWCWNLSRIIENILLSRCWNLSSVFFYYFIREIHKFRLFGSVFFLLSWCNHFFLNWQIRDFKNLPIFIWR